MLPEDGHGLRRPGGQRRAIKQREHEGDETTHRIMRALATTFVTPFDREDIHDLASQLDDILDDADAAADMFVLHRIEQPIPGMRQQADVLGGPPGKVHEAIAQLRSPARSTRSCSSCTGWRTRATGSTGRRRRCCSPASTRPWTSFG